MDLSEEEVKELAKKATMAGVEAFRGRTHETTKAAFMDWSQCNPLDMSTNFSLFYDPFRAGWREADAQENLTEEEYLWFLSFGRSLGLDTRDIKFDGNIWRNTGQQVTLVLEKSNKCPLVKLVLQRFDDRGGIWVARLKFLNLLASGQLQGNPEPEAPNMHPQDAVDEIVRCLRDDGCWKALILSRMHTGAAAVRAAAALVDRPPCDLDTEQDLDTRVAEITDAVFNLINGEQLKSDKYGEDLFFRVIAGLKRGTHVHERHKEGLQQYRAMDEDTRYETVEAVLKKIGAY